MLVIGSRTPGHHAFCGPCGPVVVVCPRSLRVLSQQRLRLHLRYRGIGRLCLSGAVVWDGWHVQWCRWRNKTHGHMMTCGIAHSEAMIVAVVIIIPHLINLDPGRIKPEGLQPSSKLFVSALLLSSCVQLGLIAPCGPWVVCTDFLPIDNDPSNDGYVHVNQSILLNRLIVKPGAVAAFPLDTADHAELRFTPTRHMVAAFFQFDSGTAVVASLPSFFLGDLNELFGSIVSRTCPASMPAAIAGYAHSGPASPALAIFSPRVRAASCVNMNVCGLDPFAAAAGGTIQPIFGRVFLVLEVPLLLELEVEESFHMLERNVVGGAAFGGHMLRVGDGECKDAAKAGMTHAVIAS